VPPAERCSCREEKAKTAPSPKPRPSLWRIFGK
jgi:hypothetical protein